MKQTFIIEYNAPLDEGGGFATVSIYADEQDMAWLKRLSDNESNINIYYKEERQ